MKNQSIKVWKIRITLIIIVGYFFYHALEFLIVLITPMFPLRPSHLPIILDNLLVPFLGKAFFWNTKFTPNLLYFLSVFTFSSISKIFLLFATYSDPKFSGPWESCFNIFSSSIFYSNNFFNSAFILGFTSFF